MKIMDAFELELFVTIALFTLVAEQLGYKNPICTMTERRYISSQLHFRP